MATFFIAVIALMTYCLAGKYIDEIEAVEQIRLLQNLRAEITKFHIASYAYIRGKDYEFISSVLDYPSADNNVRNFYPPGAPGMCASDSCKENNDNNFCIVLFSKGDIRGYFDRLHLLRKNQEFQMGFTKSLYQILDIYDSLKMRINDCGTKDLSGLYEELEQFIDTTIAIMINSQSENFKIEELKKTENMRQKIKDSILKLRKSIK